MAQQDLDQVGSRVAAMEAGIAEGTFLPGAPRAGDVPAPNPRPVVRERHRGRDWALRRALALVDVSALTLALTLALVLVGRRGEPLLDALWILPTLPGWVMIFRAYGLYERPIRRFEPSHLDDTRHFFHALVIGSLGFWLVFKFAPVQKLIFEEVLVFGVLSLLLVGCGRVAVRRAHLRLRGPERVFAVAAPCDAETLRRKMANHPEYEMELVGSIEESGDEEWEQTVLYRRLEELEKTIESGTVDHVVVQLCMPQERLVELKHACRRAHVRFSVFPRARQLLLPGVEVNHLEGMGLLSFQPLVFSRTSRQLKRGLDLFASAALLVLFSPVMALAALAIRIDSGDSVFFRQRRVGKDSERFELVKFRTMDPDSEHRVEELMEKSTDPDWLIIEDDPRVTRVGRFLRRTSIDELPQLWNVLKGEMSMVGPRPLPERDDAGIQGWGRNRLDLVPGLTGHWQVLGRNTIPFREMVEIDYAYVANWSLWQDIKLLLRTVPVVLHRRGAQ